MNLGVPPRLTPATISLTTLLVSAAVTVSTVAQGTPDPNTTDPALGDLPSYGDALFRMLLVLALIVGGLLILAKFLPRWLNARGLGTGSAKHIEVIDRVQLEPRRSLYLVKLAGRHYFLGSSETGVQLLREEPIDLDGLDAADDTQSSDDSSTPASEFPGGFKGMLASKRAGGVGAEHA